MINEKASQHTTPISTKAYPPPKNSPYFVLRNVITRYFTVSRAFLPIKVLSILTLFLLFCQFDWPTHRSLVGPHELQSIILNTPKEEKAREWSWYYTSGPHLAGTNYSQAQWTKDRWQEFGISAEIISYDTYINYPLSHRLALCEKENGTRSWRTKYEASLREDVIKDDPTTGLIDRIPTFHGYSANGNVTAQFVYVNYGTYADFEDLIQENVSLKGKIAIARYGNVFRGLKIKRAQELGMVGVILYTDPGDDGAVTKENGVVEYPEGPARQPSSVQRGSTQFLSFLPGDPTTPGYPSKPGAPRQPVENYIPSIPSIPISYLDAIPILRALNGYGPEPKDLNKWWQKQLGLKERGVNYNVGPSPSNISLNLVNEQDYMITPIWNVIGIINGTFSNEVVIIGNHRDAWVAGGAGDPNSGSAALNEVIRSFGVALSKGWKPLRTIVFASWDGEEYGLLGSTEWVEEYLPWLSSSSIAYVNVDIGTSGPNFNAAASPLLNHILYEVTSLVRSPNQTIPGQTVADLWNGGIKTMGSGSDFTAFQDFAGIPSIDLAFESDTTQVGNTGNTVYHYHSNYDSFHWMDTYGDPGFHYHVTMAKILGLFTARLVQTAVVPMRTTDYAVALKSYLSKTKNKLDVVVSGHYTEQDLLAARTRPKPGNSTVSTLGLKFLLKKLDYAVENLEEAARNHDVKAAQISEKFFRLPKWRIISRFWLFYQIKNVNRKYKYFERAFLYSEGLDKRPWFKHVVFAPGLWTGYSGSVFPGLTESIEMKEWANAERWAKIIEGCMMKAASGLL
ncbi:putative glutamate carboxypeptidase [Golovinomyces cichoracearum]|uniref:Putative glutamate carboxypeptidase n=1 Tax=Golovinomyces cichoracearum TaxID=62708 RepID=A0A420INW7_9PEZI|nr:putative glutamate carboxypeptidase [Golovinomyces cichoracearum]